MENYFDHELNYLKKELTRLKTANQKSASSAKLVRQTVNISVNLAWEDISYPYGSARATAVYEVIPNSDSIIVPTLDWYFGDVNSSYITNQATREIQMGTFILPTGNYGVYLYFVGTENGPNSDAARAKNGETITVSVNLTVTCTDNFTLRRYE